MKDGNEECEGCSKNQFPSNASLEGKPETIDQGKSRTTYSRYRCKACGTYWSVTEDEGLGGYGKYYTKNGSS